MARRAPRPSRGIPPSADLELLDSPERHQLQELARRMGGGGATTPESVSSVLPQAVVLRNRLDGQLPKSFVETTEKAIQFSVQRDYTVLSDALFVVIGPAIRKAIATFVREMTVTMNRVIDRTLSPRSVGWRIRALRTRKSFAQIVLQETLVYRVEHVFLIHRRSGVLLAEATTEDSVVRDSDMVSGMLAAVQDFVRDSLKVKTSGSLESISMGEFTIWAEPGPNAVLALVIQGTPPAELRWTMQSVLETVHLEKGEDLAVFTGDTAPFADTPQTLAACLKTQFKDEGKKFPAALAVVAGLLIVGLGVLVGLGVNRGAGRRRLVDLMKKEPGIVVVDTRRQGGRLVVYGMRDPMARDVARLAVEAGVDPADVVAQLSPYNAYLEPYILERARAILNPPNTVTLTFADGVLRAEGVADERWVTAAKPLALALSGIEDFQSTVTWVDDEPEIRRLVGEIEAATVLFRPDSPEVLEGQEAVLRRVGQNVKELDGMLDARGLDLVVTVAGHSAGIIADEESVAVSEGRAARAAAELRGMGLGGARIEESSAGVCAPAGPEATAEDRALNRRVSFLVRTEIAARGSGSP